MSSDRVTMAGATARAAVRATRSALRSRRPGPTPAVRQGRTDDGRPVALRPVTGRRTGAPHGLAVTVVTCAGHRVGELWTNADAGTSTFEIVPRFDAASDAAVTAIALRIVLDDVRARSPELRVAVRSPLDPLLSGPDPALLAGLGLTHVASFPGDPVSPQGWWGEERWELLG